MRSNAIALIGMALACSGCESKERSLEREAKAALSEVMIDPTAILTRKLSRGSDPKAICGQVNGKNRMGGYVGFQPFVAVILENNEAQVAISPYESGTATSTLGSELASYTVMYQKFCEPPAERSARLEGERLAELAAKKIEAERVAEVTAVIQREAVAEKAKKETADLFARMKGEWRQDDTLCFMEEKTGYVKIDSDTIYREGGFFAIGSIEREGSATLNFTGRRIMRDVDDAGTTTLMLDSKDPDRLNAFNESYYRCRNGDK